MESATILEQLNEIRLEACGEGYPDPSTGKPLTVEDYVPVKWSSDLEAIAQTRAAEGSFIMDHVRPNGTLCLDCTANGEQSWAENLAWNWGGGIMVGIDQWYEEKDDWVNQNTSEVIGHYESMIRPDLPYIGIGGSSPSNVGLCAFDCIAMEFGFDPSGSETQNGH